MSGWSAGSWALAAVGHPLAGVVVGAGQRGRAGAQARRRATAGLAAHRRAGQPPRRTPARRRRAAGVVADRADRRDPVATGPAHRPGVAASPATSGPPRRRHGVRRRGVEGHLAGTHHRPPDPPVHLLARPLPTDPDPTDPPRPARRRPNRTVRTRARDGGDARSICPNSCTRPVGPVSRWRSVRTVDPSRTVRTGAQTVSTQVELFGLGCTRRRVATFCADSGTRRGWIVRAGTVSRRDGATHGLQRRVASARQVDRRCHAGAGARRQGQRVRVRSAAPRRDRGRVRRHDRRRHRLRARRPARRSDAGRAHARPGGAGGHPRDPHRRIARAHRGAQLVARPRHRQARFVDAPVRRRHRSRREGPRRWARSRRRRDPSATRR